MNKIRLTVLLVVALCVAAPISTVYTGCTATTQVQTYQTLATVGVAAKAAMDTTALMYHNGQITQAQYQKVADIYDKQFQPAYNLAEATLAAGKNAFAPADVVALSTQLASLLASYQSTTK